MRTKPKYNLDGFVFSDSADLIDQIAFANSNLLYLFLRITPLIAPIRSKKSIWKTPTLTLGDLGKIAGIKNERDIKFLAMHQDRLFYYKMFVVSLSVLLSVFPALVIDGFFNIAYDHFSAFYNGRLDELLVVFIPLFVAVVLPVNLYLMRVASFFIDRYFADTLCTLTSLYLLIELSRDDCLVVPDMQRGILLRLKILARNVLLLPYCYESTSTVNNSWLDQFFGKIEGRVREYERQVIAPEKTTLETFRKEVNDLTHLFISRDFDRVSYKLPKPSGVKPPGRFDWVVQALVRFVGVAIPILLLVSLYYFPNQINTIGLDRNVIGLLSIFWLLLTLDSVLGIGVAERVSGLAKAIKDLK